MTANLRRRMPIVGLALLWLLPWAPARADDPDAVLKKAGLKRVDNSFVLEGELQARELESRYTQAERQYNQALQKKQEAYSRVEVIEQEAAMLKTQAAQSRSQSSGRSRGRGHGTGGSNNSQQAQNLENQAKQLLNQIQGNNSPLRKQIADADKQMATDQKETKALESKYRSLRDQTLSQYKDLAGRPEIVEALRTLNKGAHPMAVLGPIAAYPENLTRFCGDWLREHGLDVTNGVVHPAAEEEIAKAASAARLTLLEAEKRGKVDDATRDELAATARDLRAKVKDVEALRTRVAIDSEVAAIVAEIPAVKKKKARLGSLAHYTRAVKELEAVEHATVGRVVAEGRP